MLLWLSGTENTKWSPNENYARELMELFTLGAGNGYTERDVREQARALTGLDNDWRRGIGPHNFHFDKKRHDAGIKRIFGKARRLRLAGRGAALPRAPAATRRSSSTSSGATSSRRRRTARRAALDRPVPGRRRDPAAARGDPPPPGLHTGPRMVKPPVVYTAGLLRALGRGIDTDSWSWLSDMSGQRLFNPPNVAGWDDARWLDTATFRGRWWRRELRARSRTRCTTRRPLAPGRSREALVDGALAFWGSPTLRPRRRRAARVRTARDGRRRERELEADVVPARSSRTPAPARRRPPTSRPR